MTDHELLELAAKAAGVSGSRDTDGGYVYLDGSGGDLHCVKWNPIKDDGDALRLAVKLHIGLRYPSRESYTGNPNIAQARHWDCGEIEEHIDDYGGDMLVATRRAIVRAAAEIAKAESQ